MIMNLMNARFCVLSDLPKTLPVGESSLLRPVLFFAALAVVYLLGAFALSLHGGRRRRLDTCYYD